MDFSFFPSEEFQRAARAVIGKRLNDVIVNTVFLLFDADGDGHLSAEEFISVMRSYLARGTRGQVGIFLLIKEYFKDLKHFST